MAASSSPRSARERCAFACFVVFGSLCGACGGSGETRQATSASESVPATRSVCSDCPAVAGGESSDFGGSPHPCTLFEGHVPITEARAVELGFDMASITSLIEREIDAPLRWTESAPNRGGAPKGYEQQTRIEGRARRGDWLTYVGLDPERCAGTTCRGDDVGQWTCSDRLELGIEVELRTLDGAVSATASGYVLQGREGFSFETPAGSQRANLRDVSGSLKLFPPERPAIVLGLLMIDLFFKPDLIEGDLRPYYQLSARPGTAEDYIPLSGHWPDVPALPDTPVVASPDVSKEHE